MESLLKEVKSTTLQSSHSDEPFLRNLQTTPRASIPDGQPKDVKTKGATTSAIFEVKDPREFLALFKTDLSPDQFTSLLKQLLSPDGFDTPFHIQKPGPLQAQILALLSSPATTNMWPALKSGERHLLITAFLSLTGINALIEKLRSISKRDTFVTQAAILIEILRNVLSGHDVFGKLWDSLQCVQPNTQYRATWKEIVSLMASGKIPSSVAQAESLLDKNILQKNDFLSHGPSYAVWLSSNIAHMAAKADHEAAEFAAMMAAKGLSLGYSSIFIGSLVKTVLQLQTNASSPLQLNTLVRAMPMPSRLKLIRLSLLWLSELTATRESSEKEALTDSDYVSSMAALISDVVGQDEASRQLVRSFITDPQLASSIYMTLRRSIIACVRTEPDLVQQNMLEKLLIEFGNPIFIKHAPITQQESIAQHILVITGYLHRIDPMAILVIARSSHHMQGVSNRLESYTARLRWLGMIVATAISSLVDKEGSRMRFGTEDMETTEAVSYLALTALDDTIGRLEDLLELLKESDKVSTDLTTLPRKIHSTHGMPILNGRPVFGPVPPPSHTSRSKQLRPQIIGDRIRELTDDDIDEQPEELRSYTKPDSDPEDSDDDATLVNRQKVRPPVYIRDLLSMLHDDKTIDRFQTGIEHAATLIRRKQSFGKEVKDHAEELLRTLCNLQDPFGISNYDTLRLQAMIAALLSDIDTLVPWLSRHAFAGEYSLSQRATMLSAIGLAGRELAGLKDEDVAFNAGSNDSEQAFPSKRLPDQLHATYTSTLSSNHQGKPQITPAPFEAVGRNLEHQLIRPIALEAADRTTAHLNAVKIQTFSSSSRNKLSAEQRTRRKLSPTNRLSKLFAQKFYHPLVSRYRQDVIAFSTSSLFLSVPFLLVMFLKTLAILLHASGPATSELRVVSEDFWDLLLSLRVQAAGEQSVMEAVLFALLTLLETNEDNKTWIATTQARLLVETRDWVQIVFERASDVGRNSGGGSSIGILSVTEEPEGPRDEAKLRTLAAGVLVKIQEIVDAHQDVLFGRMV